MERVLLPVPQMGSTALICGAAGTVLMVTVRGTSALRQLLPSVLAT